MALREVVDNCGDGSRAANPVLRMIDAFTGDKAAFHVRNHIHRRSRYYSHKETLYELWDESKFQDKWMAQRIPPQMMMADSSAGPMRQAPGRPEMTLDEFRHFEEEQMMRDFDRMDLGMHMDPRMRGAGPMPYGRPPMDPRAFDMMQAKNRGPRNLPPELLEQMGPQHHAPLNMDNKAWDNEYEAAIRGPEASSAPPLDRSEAEMFDRFEREFAPPGARAGLHGPARLQGPPSQLQHGAPDWASEFDQDQQESKFADWERIYRGEKDASAYLAEDWAKEFEAEYPELVESGGPIDLARARADQRAASQIASIQDPKFRQSELFKMMSALSNGDIAFQGDKVVPLPPEQKEALNTSAQPPAEKWASEFEEEQGLNARGGVWQREFESFAGPRGATGEFEEDAEFDEAEFDRKFGKAWADDFAKFTEGMPLGEGLYDDPEGMGNFDFGGPASSEYKLAENNPFEGDTGAFERGKELFKAGRLTEAIEAFEAAVKQNPTHSLAWQMLGATQAENDRDDLASLALLKAVQVDPDNRDALITLSVSYTNDFHKFRALECLQQWLASTPTYQSISTNVPLGPNFEENHTIITNLFIQAARMRPHDPDPDVQVALGLLYNLTFEYDKAIDCFKAAAMARPDDYLIWNKLGATQANAKYSEEAIDAFIRALEIKPSYTRACSNLGISFMALNEYGEAAKAFLSALALNPNALHQWDNLRNVFSLMRRPDLLKKCDTKDISLFMDEFHF